MKRFHPSPKKKWVQAACILLFFAIVIFALPIPMDATLSYTSFFFLALVVLASAMLETARMLLITYTMSDDAITMEKTFLSSFKHTIPFKSIDNIFTKASAVDRLLSLADVYIDTPGGFGFEMVMHDIPQEVADELLAAVKKVKGSG
ncbi:MAG: PH domain-containing protein [Candidatus Micrarchaeota archaeon]|nr:PH domain-containing protein [Candidatus Micrarchaeota archaeon]